VRHSVSGLSALSSVRRFFELVNEDRLDEARELIAGTVVTFPIYHAEAPVIRGAAPLMERTRVLRARGVEFLYDRFEDLGDGYVLAQGTIGTSDDREESIMLIRVDSGCIVTVEAHHSLDDVQRTLRG
jgi:hypothetical protein